MLDALIPWPRITLDVSPPIPAGKALVLLVVGGRCFNRVLETSQIDHILALFDGRNYVTES